MAVKRWGNARVQYVDTVAVGNPPLNGGRLFFYVAGTSTKQNTYTDSTGATPNSNPVVLNSAGEPSTEIWLTVGQTYKVGLAIAGVDDPPASFLWTEDNVAPLNDVTITQQAQWLVFAGVPTFISGTSFSVLGDQRLIFDQGRRLQTVNTAGTLYSTVSAAPTFDGTRTTATVFNDSSPLDSGLSSINYGVLSKTNPSIPFPIPYLLPSNAICSGRLTLTTGVPVTTADVLAATTIFFTPFLGNNISTHNGNYWTSNAFTEKSVAVPSTTSNPFDVFIVDGTLALETLTWTNDTTRSTALVLQDGILVKSGDSKRRYLGTGRTTTVSGQTEDSIAKRYLWNYYNRMPRKMLVQEATASWTYSTATYRQANAAATNQLDMVIGVSESPVSAEVLVSATNTASQQMQAGIGIDSTTVNGADLYPLDVVVGSATAANSPLMTAKYDGFPGVGRHFLAWLEWSGGAGTTTWNGTAGTAHSGIRGSLLG